jgi:carbamoyl-phosphate synthase small subunit
MNDKKTKLKLILEDGSEYEGYGFGAEVETEGEVVFSTGMVGYPESLTDPSFEDQILVCTFPLIGNYGVDVIEYDENQIITNFESDRVHIKGLIVSDYSEKFNHYEAKKSLSAWLEQHNVPGITGIDTRALTKKIREKGSLLGKIVKADSNYTKDFKDPNQENLVAQVSISEPKTYGEGKKTVLLLDCGMKQNILRNLVSRGVKVIRAPWNYDFNNTDLQFDAIFLSNGPGNPELLTEIVDKIKIAMQKEIPVVGICLGVQLLAIAAGAKTYKLKYGHRSQNQPCINLETGNCFLTSQNHGYAVDEKSLPSDYNVWFKNANDESVEGIKHKSKPYAAVQFHPESEPGPTDTLFLFDELLKIAKVI